MTNTFSQCIGKCNKKFILDPGHSNDIYPSEVFQVHVLVRLIERNQLKP